MEVVKWKMEVVEIGNAKWHGTHRPQYQSIVKNLTKHFSYNTKQGSTPVVSRVLPVPFLKYINNKAFSLLPGNNLLLPYN